MIALKIPNKTFADINYSSLNPSLFEIINLSNFNLLPNQYSL